MKNWIKKYSGIIYILAATAVVLILVFTNDEMPRIVKALSNLNGGWVCLGAVLMAVYLLLRSATLVYALRIQSEHIGIWDVILVTGIGQFYSAITPSASGGQPMQVLALHKRGIGAVSGTAALSMKYVGFQLAFLIIGLLAWVLNPGLVNAQLYGFRWLVVIGFLVNAILGFLLVLVSINVSLVERVLYFFINLGKRMRLVKDVEAAQSKIMGYIYDYRVALNHFISRPFSALVMLLLSIAQVLAFSSVAFCLYKAFELSGYSYIQVTALQILLFLSASFMPLPGAAGAQEGGFYLFYKGIFPSDGIIAAMLCWRLFTYYLLMLWGLVCVVLGKLQEMRKLKRRDKSDGR